MMTQKRKGIETLSKCGYLVPPLRGYIAADTTKEEFDQYPFPSLMAFPLFARPCPMRPRHGFVDSRIVQDKDELWGVVQETFKADPEGEVLLMTPIDAKLNAVITPSLITVGKGHDGATAGKDPAMMPLVGLDPAEIDPLCKEAGVGEEEDPYFEVVTTSGGQEYLTQLRAGPKIQSLSPDYIPEEVIVERILTAGGDLLEWERMILSAQPGSVVWHPRGSLADHYFVHARSARIPVLTTREPILGERLIPLEKIEEPDVELVLRGLQAGFQHPTLQVPFQKSVGTEGYQYQKMANLLLQILHNSAAMTGPQSWWLGYGTAIGIRLGYIAAMGEGRHFYQGQPSQARGKVYEQAQAFDLKQIVHDFPELFTAFRYGVWKSSGFGGKKWAQCLIATHQVLVEVLELVKDPTLNRVGKMLRALNTMIHQEHNGGWWFGKFIDFSSMTKAGRHELKLLTDAIPAIMDARTQYQKLTDLAEWREGVMGLSGALTTPEVSADLGLYVPYSGRIQVQLGGQILGDHGRKLLVGLGTGVIQKRKRVKELLRGSWETQLIDGKLVIKTPTSTVFEDVPLGLTIEGDK